MPNLTVEITSKDGGVLNTANKHCRDNIHVIPKLQNKTVTENGTVSADDGYSGIGEVTVDVKNGANSGTTSAFRTITNSAMVAAGEPSARIILQE